MFVVCFVLYIYSIANIFVNVFFVSESNSVEIKILKGPLCTTDTSIKTADSKQRENHCNAITSITLLTQDDVFKCYVNKTMLLSHLKKDIALNVFSQCLHSMSSVNFAFSSRKVTIMYTCRVVLESSKQKKFPNV
jgi:hypothetical protein